MKKAKFNWDKGVKPKRLHLLDKWWWPPHRVEWLYHRQISRFTLSTSLTRSQERPNPRFITIIISSTNISKRHYLLKVKTLKSQPIMAIKSSTSGLSCDKCREDFHSNVNLLRILIALQQDKWIRPSIWTQIIRIHELWLPRKKECSLAMSWKSEIIKIKSLSITLMPSQSNCIRKFVNPKKATDRKVQRCKEVAKQRMVAMAGDPGWGIEYVAKTLDLWNEGQRVVLVERGKSQTTSRSYLSQPTMPVGSDFTRSSSGQNKWTQ